jgi:hypothetical protein
MPEALTLEQKKEKVLQAQKDRLAEIANRGSSRRNLFNGTEGKLKVNQLIEGYHLHILNDTPGRIDTGLQSGYEFVTPEEVNGVTNNVVSRNTDIGDKVRFLVGRTEQGEPLYAYLMKIKQEWYDLDQKELASKNDKIDEAIRKGRGHKANTDGFYIPKDGIKIS